MSEKEVEETKDIMKEIATHIEGELKQMNPRLGFSLIVFEFGGSNRVNYISNGRREDMLQAHKDLVCQIEESDP